MSRKKAKVKKSARKAPVNAGDSTPAPSKGSTPPPTEKKELRERYELSPYQ